MCVTGPSQCLIHNDLELGLVPGRGLGTLAARVLACHTKADKGVSGPFLFQQLAAAEAFVFPASAALWGSSLPLRETVTCSVSGMCIWCILGTPNTCPYLDCTRLQPLPPLLDVLAALFPIPFILCTPHYGDPPPGTYCSTSFWPTQALHLVDKEGGAGLGNLGDCRAFFLSLTHACL